MSRDISDAVLEGDPYEQAAALTRRVFPVSLDGKIRICYLILSSAVGFAPAIALRRELIRTVEPTAASETPAFVAVGGLGVVLTFLFGLAFVRLRLSVRDRHLDFESAAHLIRVEDLLMTFAVSTGLLFVVVPLSLATLGALSPGSVFWLYERDVRVYRPSASLLANTALVSGGGVVSAAVLFVLDTVTRR